MLIDRVSEKGGVELLQVAGPHLSFMRRQGDNLVAVGLDGPRLMHIDMACADCDDTLIASEHAIDDGGVGLRTSHKEEDVGIRTLTCQTDFLPGMSAPDVITV